MKNITETINYLIKQKIHFAIYSLPNSDDITLIVSENKNSNPQAGFAIQEFSMQKDTYYIADDIVLQNEEICVSRVEHCSDNRIDYELEKDISYNVFSKNQYEEYVSHCIKECETERTKKIVPARIKAVEKVKNFNVGTYFLKLKKEYKSAFVNLYFHTFSGLWIGVTPELLIKETLSKSFVTNSLAGTKLISRNRDWTTKEKEEQQIVTDYIVNSLTNNACNIENELKVKTIEAGLIQHLKTTIEFSSSQNFNVLAKILHPTPAVCGMPLIKAYNFINKYEKKQRQCYTGFVGVNTKNDKQLYVNLRCMQILENKFLVYIGAGVTKDSIPEKEYLETENKSQTLLGLL